MHTKVFSLNLNLISNRIKDSEWILWNKLHSDWNQYDQTLQSRKQHFLALIGNRNIVKNENEVRFCYILSLEREIIIIQSIADAACWWLK